MRSRIEYIKAAPELLEAIEPLNNYVRDCGLESSLIDLVLIRASQINGCAYCIDMHTKDARARGETEQRIYELDAWRETPFYSEREMAALAWTEAVTLISDGHVPDDVYEEARKWFTEVELGTHSCHRAHQYLESSEHCFPVRAGAISAGSSIRGRKGVRQN